MQVAVPLFGDDVAPRFCSADRILLVETADGAERSRAIIEAETGTVGERLALLNSRGVHEVLCGGFSRRYLSLASSLGIHVTWGLYGSADEALRAYLTGSLPAMSLPAQGALLRFDPPEDLHH